MNVHQQQASQKEAIQAQQRRQQHEQPHPLNSSSSSPKASVLSDQTDPFNTTGLSDRFFTGGATSVVSEPLQFHHPQEKTLRYFPLSSGKKNCYIIPNLPSGLDCSPIPPNCLCCCCRPQSYCTEGV
ncbi:hypothetical protein ACFX15_001062 [Malus domestica]